MVKQVNNLIDITDYYSETSKITPTFNIGSIYIDDCSSKGKLYIVGNSTDDITEKIYLIYLWHIQLQK